MITQTNNFKCDFCSSERSETEGESNDLVYHDPVVSPPDGWDMVTIKGVYGLGCTVCAPQDDEAVALAAAEVARAARKNV